MGQKVNPNGFRYGITKKRNATWIASKQNFAKFLLEDNKMRNFIAKYNREYAIGNVEILRNQKGNVTVKIHSAKPGVILGEGGKNLETFRKKLQRHTKNHQLKLNVQVETIEKPELNAKLVAEDIATKLENRASFRIAQRFAIRAAFKAGAKGVKTQVAGRLNGADMARTEGYTEGEMKLHTLRQNVNFGKAIARTTYGAIGVKVWISQGDVFGGGS